MYGRTRVAVPRTGFLDVYTRHDLTDRIGRVAICTLDDLQQPPQSQPSAFAPFFENNVLRHVSDKSFVIHVTRPLDDLDGRDFTLDDLAHDLTYVLDAFDIPTVLAVGEGAAANVLLRLGLSYPNRVMGLVLLDCVAGHARADEQVLHSVINMQRQNARLMQKLLHLVSPRRPHQEKGEELQRIDCAYVDAYMRRNDLRPYVKDLKVDTLLVCGSRAPTLAANYSLNRRNARATLLAVVDGVSDVLYEAPVNLARAFLLFAKGVGLLLSVPIIGLEREFERVRQRQLEQKQRALLQTERSQEGLDEEQVVLMLYDVD